MIRAFLFDLDETLIDRSATVAWYIKDQHRRFELHTHVTLDVYQSRFEQLDQRGYANRRTVFQSLATEFELPVTADTLVSDFYERAWENCVLFPGVETTLCQLGQQGYKLGIVTNGSQQSQRAKLAGTDLPGLVDTVLISGEEVVKKPDREIFTRAADRLDVSPESCVFVGDNPEADILGAHSAGMIAIWLKGDRPWPDSLVPTPDHTIANISEVLLLEF